MRDDIAKSLGARYQLKEDRLTGLAVGIGLFVGSTLSTCKGRHFGKLANAQARDDFTTDSRKLCPKC